MSFAASLNVSVRQLHTPRKQMRANQTFKKLQILTTRNIANLAAPVLTALSTIDPSAHLLSLEKALISRTVSKKLWDSLPPEHLSYQFGSIEALKNSGQEFLGDKYESPIILHCGWDVLAFATTVRAAWETMENYYQLTTESYNICLYPESFDWFVIRAGKNLYPMDCMTSETAKLVKLEGIGLLS
jgi:hypothetical protein